MDKSIVLFVDNDIFSLVNDYAQNKRKDKIKILKNSTSFSECFDNILQNHPDSIIIQLQTSSDLGGCLDFMHSLDNLDYIPILLIFEKRPDNIIIYTTTDSSLKPAANMVSEFFAESVSSIYSPEFTFFRHAEADEDPNVLKREEALEEILRGCGYSETKDYIDRFNLDLRGNGYYLFFWELQSAEYVYHYYNKNVYNMMGSILGKRFLEIVNEYSGGEKIRLSLNRFCFIINALSSSSEATKYSAFERLVNQLTFAGSCKTGSGYISSYIERIEDFRIYRDKYEENKSCSFFLKFDGLLREENIRNIKLHATMNLDVVIPSLQKISDYIRYDCKNPTLTKELHHLYIDILKPSVNFTLYYFCIASICSDIVKNEKNIDMSLLTDTMTPERLRFSSIEEQYDILLGYISEFQKKSEGKIRSQNSIVMDAIDYIKNNYQNDIVVPDIADALHICPTYLSQVFRKIVGTSVIKYIINVRIDHAKELLETTNQPIYAIADMVGFRDIKHFSKTFKSITGTPPNAYRASFYKEKTGAQKIN